MPFDPERHHRQSQRLRGYDYSQSGSYFVTIVTQNRACWFGDPVDGAMQLTIPGLVVESWWGNLGRRFPAVTLDTYVVMPNHLHGIIRIDTDSTMPDGTPPVTSLARIVGWFKTMTTNDYLLGVKQYDWPPFDGRLWLRNYHDRIIRNESELARIRHYIAMNPARWADDDEHPERTLK